MKKLILIATMAIILASCKKEVITPAPACKEGFKMVRSKDGKTYICNGTTAHEIKVTPGDESLTDLKKDL